MRHVTYRSAGAVVTGTLSLPAGAGPFPAVLYAPGVSCSRDMFAADVAALQRDGIAALAIDPPDGRDPFVHPISADPEDGRRGARPLRHRPAPRAGRAALVARGRPAAGSATSATAGAASWAATSPACRSPSGPYVLTYAGADWVGADPTAADGFAADPAAAVGAAPPGAYLFIAGVDDPLFSRASVTRYARAASGSTRLEWLPGGHGDYWATPGGAAQAAAPRLARTPPLTRGRPPRGRQAPAVARRTA